MGMASAEAGAVAAASSRKAHMIPNDDILGAVFVYYFHFLTSIKFDLKKKVRIEQLMHFGRRAANEDQTAIVTYTEEQEAAADAASDKGASSDKGGSIAGKSVNSVGEIPTSDILIEEASFEMAALLSENQELKDQLREGAEFSPSKAKTAVKGDTMVTVSRPFYVVPIIMIVFLSMLTIYAFTVALTLSPPNKPEQWLPKQHSFQRWIKIMTTEYEGDAEDRYCNLYVNFGFGDLDRSGFVEWYALKNRGNVVWDENFDVYHPDSIRFALQACKRFTDKKCTLQGCQHAAPKLAVPYTQKCPMDEFLKAHGVTQAEIDATANYAACGKNCPAITLPATLDTRKKFFDELWLFYHSDSNVPINGKGKYTWQYLIGWVDGQVRYLTFHQRITLPIERSHTDRYGVYEMVEKLALEGLDENSPPTMGVAQHNTDIEWIYTFVELYLVATLRNGILICFVLSLFVLILATKNVTVTFFAWICIFTIIVNVLGAFKYWFGWDLGTGETICGLIAIGFSIDYILHLSHVYLEARERGIVSRHFRMKYAMDQMGATILGAAVTTAAAGIVMFLCQFTFFNRFATMIIATIFASFVFCMCYFVPLLLLFGPEGESCFVCTKPIDDEGAGGKNKKSSSSSSSASGTKATKVGAEDAGAAGVGGANSNDAEAGKKDNDV